jgi:hypothetical protein
LRESTDGVIATTDAAKQMQGLSFALSIAALMAGGTGTGYETPPVFSVTWAVTWTLAFAAVFCALLGLSIRRTLTDRAAASISILLCLAGSWLSLTGYFNSYLTYPWIVVVLLGFGPIIGGVLLGLRVIPALLALFISIWFYGAFLPPSAGVPDSQVNDRLECILLDKGRIRLQGPEGTDLSRYVVLENVLASERVGPIISSPPWHCHAFLQDMDGSKTPGNIVDLSFRNRAPKWSRSYNLAITVFRWPTPSHMSLGLPLKPLPVGRVSASLLGYTASISDFAWVSAPSDANAFPGSKQFSCLLQKSGYPYSGSTSLEFRVVDDQGRVLVSQADSTDGNKEHLTVSLLPSSKRIRFEFYTPRQRVANKLEFEFRGIPIG